MRGIAAYGQLLYLLRGGQSLPGAGPPALSGGAGQRLWKIETGGGGLVFAHRRDTGALALVYRLPGVFGMVPPSYNSVVATFCHHIARISPSGA